MKIIKYIIIIVISNLLLSNVMAQNNQPVKKAGESFSNSYMKVRARIQTRIMAGEKDSPYASVRDYDALDFNFRRLRIGFIFQGDDWYGGIIDLRLENFLSKPEYNATDQSIDNSYSAIELANMWFKTGLPESKLTFGQFKLPFFREGLMSSSNLIIPERAFQNSYIQLYDIGVLFTVNPLGFSNAMQNKFKFYLSLTNGDGAGDDGEGRTYVEANSSGEPTAPLWNTRLEYHPLGGPSGKNWSEGTEIFQQNTLLSFGLSGMYTESAEVDKFANNLSVSGFGFDTTMLFSRIYVNSGITSFIGNAANDNLSWQATLGYVIPIGQKYFMIATRYDYYEKDTGGDGTIQSTEKKEDIWVGINYYFLKHTVKGQLYYLIRRDHLGTSGADLNDNVIYFQMQTNFGKKIL